MSSLLAACMLFAMAGAAAALTRKRLEEQLPLAVCAVTGVLYAFGLAGGLTAGFYAVGTLAVLSAGVLLAGLASRQRRDVWKRIVTPGSVVFGCIVLWALISYRGYMYTEWDDFSHWGLAVKNMFLFSALPSGVPEATITYVDYPPASTLFEWFWTRLSGAFNEGDTQRAMNVMMMCYLLPVLSKQQWKKPGKALAMAGSLFILPLAVYPNVYRTLQVDCLLGCQALYILHTWFEEKHDRAAMISLCAALFMMTLVKEIGTLVALMLIVIMAADEWVSGNRNAKRLAQTALMLLAAVLLARLSWQLYLQVHQVAPVWDKSALSFAKIMALLSGKAPVYQYRSVVKFVKYLCTPWWHTGHLVNLSHIMWILFMAGLQGWCVTHAGDDLQQKRCRQGFLLLLAEVFAYIIVLMMTYLFLMRPDEAENLVSMDRYLASFMLPLIGWTMLTAIRIWERTPGRAAFNMAFVMLLGLLMVVHPLMVLENTAFSYEKNNADYETRMNELIPEEAVSVLKSETDRVYIVAVGDNGYQYYLGAYQLTPVPVQSGQWTTWPVCEKQPQWYEKWAVEYTPDQWAQTLLDGGFTHVYLDTVNDRFRDDYQSLFETRTSIQSAILYRVEADAEGVKLIALQ